MHLCFTDNGPFFVQEISKSYAHVTGPWGQYQPSRTLLGRIKHPSHLANIHLPSISECVFNVAKSNFPFILVAWLHLTVFFTILECLLQLLDKQMQAFIGNLMQASCVNRLTQCSLGPVLTMSPSINALTFFLNFLYFVLLCLEYLFEDFKQCFIRGNGLMALFWCNICIKTINFPWNKSVYNNITMLLQINRLCQRDILNLSFKLN